jgi:hypothetical protein
MTTVPHLTRYGRNTCRLCGEPVDYHVTRRDFEAGCDLGRVDCEACGLVDDWRPIKAGRK